MEIRPEPETLSRVLINIKRPNVGINWAGSLHQLSLCRHCRGYRPSRREELKKTSPVVDHNHVQVWVVPVGARLRHCILCRYGFLTW
ncbi:hypothetical protein ACROYT_G018255 [Oculina patagonica]